jgi:O-antigen ligase
MGVGIAVVLVLSMTLKIIRWKKILAILLIGFAMLSITTPMTISYLTTRPESSKVRIYLFKVGLDMISAHPILGYGLNNHAVVKPEYDSFDRSGGFLPVHNYYLVVASEVGIPGLIFLLGVLITTCMLALRAARINDRYLAGVAVGIFGGLVAVMVNLLVDFIASPVEFSLLWLYAGLAAALSNPNVKYAENGAYDERGIHVGEIAPLIK